MSLADQQWCPTSVQVTVLQARGLRIKGKSGTNDAYAVMQVGKEKYQTSVVEKSVAPVWREEAAFDLPPLQQGGGGGSTERSTLHVHVLHRALVGPDKLLGQAVVNLLQLSEDKTRNKTEWFKLLDKTGKADKDRGEVLVDIQFLRNNMTGSMFDLSAAGKSKSRLGKFKDKVRGKKKESDAASAVVPSFSQVLTDSEEEGNGDDEVPAGKDEKKKKLKMKSLFSPKSNLQRNMSQSMSVLPAKNSSLSGSLSSGLNVESSEGKKKFKFMKHKRSGSSDSKDSASGQKHGAAEQNILCINGSHVYCEEPQSRTSRIGSNFSLTSSGHGSMEDVPESSPPSVDSLRAVRQYSPWTEEEEEETTEVENIEEDVGELRREEEERVRRQEEELERLTEEKKRQEEEKRKAEEENVKQEEEERIRREEEERAWAERRRQEEEERVRREEEEECERLAEENRRLEEQEIRRIEEEEKRLREEGERLRMEEEARMRQEEEHTLAEEKRRLEEERRIEEEKVRKQEEERAQEERRRREEEEMVRRQEKELEEKRRLEEQERQRKEEEIIKEKERRQEEEKARREKDKYERLVEEKRKLEEEERKKFEEEEKLKREEEEMIRVEEEKRAKEEEEERVRRQEEEREKLAEQKRILEEQERRRIEEGEKRQRAERIRKEEERMRKEEEEERVRRQEKEEVERLAEEKRRREEEEERRRNEEEKVKREEEERIRKEEDERAQEERRRQEEERRRQEEEERVRREEKAEMESKEEQARKLDKEKMVGDAEVQKRRENNTKHKAPEMKSKVAMESPAEVTSTNPFDENISNNPFEEIHSSAAGPDGSTAKVSTVRQRCQSAESSVGRKTVSTDEKDLISSQREKRPAPQPPGRNQAERQSQKEQDGSTPHLAQINKQSKDKDLKTVSVLPQRSVQIILPLSRSPTETKNTQSLAQSSTTKGTTNVAKHNKRPAPSRPPSVEEGPSSEPKTALSSDGNISHECGSEAKQEPTVYGLNPFEDDENELTVQDDTTTSCKTALIQWPPAMSQGAEKDATSQTKIKSSKVARAPPLPTTKAATSSTLISQNTEGGHAADETGVMVHDNRVTHACVPESIGPLYVQESPSAGEEASGKKEGPPTASRSCRLQPVKPLNPLEQQAVSVVGGEKDNKSTGILCGDQKNTKVNDTGLKGPFSQLTQEELISLVLKQKNQLSERDKKISELEQYIDNLLVRVIEEQPSILMSMNSLKKSV